MDDGRWTMDVGIIARILVTLHHLRSHDAWTPAALQAHQARALGVLRAHAYTHSAFYRRFHHGLMDRPLPELPVLTKADLMANFDQIITDAAISLAGVEAHLASLTAAGTAAASTGGTFRRYLGRYWVNATSGSSGQRGFFVFNAAEWATIIASFARAQEWGGARVNLVRRRKMATVASTSPWHMSSLVADTVRSPFVDSFRISAATPLDRIVAQLNARQPELLIAYASMMRLLAEEAQQGRLRVAPSALFTSSEPLTRETRTQIERTWGKVLFDQYGATECGSLAMECDRHAGLHLAEDLTLVEVVDQHGRPVPPGEYGERVLVTVLAGRTMPLIRYELDDSVRLSALTCPCGRPFRLLDDIQGRTEDILEFDTPTGPVRVHPHTFHRIMDTAPAASWRVIQEPDAVRLLLAGTTLEAAERLAGAIRDTLARQGVRDVPVNAECVDAIARSASGKSPLVVAARGQRTKNTSA